MSRAAKTRTRSPTFTDAELRRFTKFCKSVGDSFGAVEKQPNGAMRLLPASAVGAGGAGEESDALAAWDKAVGIQ